MKYISQEGLEKLKGEVERRKTEIRKEIAGRLEEAKGLGDLSENAEYQSAKEAQIFNESRIMELEALIKKSVLIRPGRNGRKNKIDIGSRIEVEQIGKGTGKKEFYLVGFQEANPLESKISNESPLGKAFLGKEVGDIIEVETPKGKVKYKIISIR